MLQKLTILKGDIKNKNDPKCEDDLNENDTVACGSVRTDYFSGDE